MLKITTHTLCLLSLMFVFYSKIQAQVHPSFPQALVNNSLKKAFQKSLQNNPRVSTQKPAAQNSFKSLFQTNLTLKNKLAKFTKQANTLSKVSTSDTVVVGFTPNDTLVITGVWNHTGPIFVFNDGVLIIKNAQVTNIGEVYVFGHGKLFADSSSLTFPQQYFYERSLLVVQNGYARIQNCSLNYSGYSHNLFLADSAVAEFNAIHQNDFTTCGLFGAPTVRINGCNLTGEFILSGNSHAEFKNADTLLLWHQFPDSSIINYAFPNGDTVLTYAMNNTVAGINGIDFTVQVDSCKTVWWALMPENGSDVTLSNSKIRAIGAWFMRGDTASITGLYDNSNYVNYVMPVADRNLHLINSSVQTWSLYVFDSSAVNITACQLGEVGCQQNSSVISSQFILDGSGGYFWATDTSFIVADNVSVYSTTRSEKNGIFILGYSWLPFMAPQAIGNSVFVSVQNDLVQDPVAFNNANTWLLSLAQPDTAYTNSVVSVNGSVWLDHGPDGGWMNFDSYSLYFQAAGDSSWTSLVLDSATEIRNNVLGSWNTAGLLPGFYILRLVSKNDLGDSVDAFSAVTLLQSTVGFSTPDKTNFTISVSPNPSNGIVNFEINALKNETLILEIENELGEKISSTTLAALAGDNKLTQRIVAKPGIYFYRLLGSMQTQNGKIVLH